ncbi:hypothetical protein [Rhizobium sp. AP16]|uniref:hypothetical protein n=1 Tax=Rhizobium sp. AP16 TaxID=1144306 RepID=UPI00026EE6AB|nr:hypothetical protein [Rhizobium sp. AP16]EJK80620.1 hypothetical protein PMI03_04752 [Rhizobium sp. AP16]
MSTLPQILKSVDWHANIDSAFADAQSLQQLENALYRIAIWSHQLEIADQANPALCFVREMQVAAQQGAALIGLCLYKSAAAAARTIVETCLYYTFFRTHLEELSTLVRVEKYYTSKSEILDYHKIHTESFVSYQEAFGLIGNLEQWYSRVSAVVHGQIPGAWNNHAALDQISYDSTTHALAVETITTAERLVHELLLCTTGQRLWSSFAPDAKKQILKGLAGDKRSLLGLDFK